MLFDEEPRGSARQGWPCPSWVGGVPGEAVYCIFEEASWSAIGENPAVSGEKFVTTSLHKAKAEEKQIRAGWFGCAWEPGRTRIS